MNAATRFARHAGRRSGRAGASRASADTGFSLLETVVAAALGATVLAAAASLHVGATRVGAMLADQTVADYNAVAALGIIARVAYTAPLLGITRTGMAACGRADGPAADQRGAMTARVSLCSDTVDFGPSSRREHAKAAGMVPAAAAGSHGSTETGLAGRANAQRPVVPRMQEVAQAPAPAGADETQRFWVGNDATTAARGLHHSVASGKARQSGIVAGVERLLVERVLIAGAGRGPMRQAYKADGAPCAAIIDVRLDLHAARPAPGRSPAKLRLWSYRTRLVVEDRSAS
jgi:hypothetical protein